MTHQRLSWYVMSEAICSRFSFGIIGFALPLYALHLGMDEKIIGLLMAMHFGFEVAFKPFLGRISDRHGRKLVLCLALTLRSTVALALGFASSILGLFAIRALHGISESIREPTMSAFLVETNAKKVMSAFARYNSVRMLSGAFGKACAGYMLVAFSQDFSLLFLVAFIISAGSIVAVYLIPSGTRKDTKVESGKEELVEVPAGSPANMPIYVYGYLCGVSASILNLLFPVLAVKYGGLNEAEVGTIYLLGGLAVLGFTVLIERLDGKVPDLSFLSARAASTVGSTVIYGTTTGLVPFALAAAVDEGGKLAFKAGWGSLLAKASAGKPEVRAAVASRFGVIENLAEISGPVIGGLLLASGGPLLLLGTRAGVSILGESFLFLTLKKS